MALSMKEPSETTSRSTLSAHGPRFCAEGTTTAISATVSAARSASMTHSTMGLPATGTSPLMLTVGSMMAPSPPDKHYGVDLHAEPSSSSVTCTPVERVAVATAHQPRPRASRSDPGR